MPALLATPQEDVESEEPVCLDLTPKGRKASPEQRIWIRVIEQQLRDACTRSMHRDGARSWFQNRSADFVTVCDLAGANPSIVRTMALRRFR